MKNLKNFDDFLFEYLTALPGEKPKKVLKYY